MINGKKDAIDNIAQSISKSKIDISITKSPRHFRAKFILQALNIITFIFGDVVRIPA